MNTALQTTINMIFLFPTKVFLSWNIVFRVRPRDSLLKESLMKDSLIQEFAGEHAPWAFPEIFGDWVDCMGRVPPRYTPFLLHTIPL